LPTSLRTWRNDISFLTKFSSAAADADGSCMPTMPRDVEVEVVVVVWPPGEDADSHCRRRRRGSWRTTDEDEYEDDSDCSCDESDDDDGSGARWRWNAETKDEEGSDDPAARQKDRRADRGSFIVSSFD